MRIETVLTVAESKRLIAKGVRQLEMVQRAMENGMVAIAKGTTGTYIAEEFTGERIEPFAYTTGLTLPKVMDPAVNVKVQKRGDVVFRDGKRVDLSVNDAVKQMGPGDVFIKGANALNYEKKVAGILIGHPLGGTIGNAIGPAISRKVHLVIAVGLEKCIPFDILELSRQIPARFDEASRCTSLMPVTGLIVTEIEALKALADVEVVQVGAGGVGGAEGAVWLQIEGDRREIEKVEKILEAIHGERAFR